MVSSELIIIKINKQKRQLTTGSNRIVYFSRTVKNYSSYKLGLKHIDIFLKNHRYFYSILLMHE